MIQEINPDIRSLLENLEFIEHYDKPKLFYKILDQQEGAGKIGITAYIDFRNNYKGRCFYVVEGVQGIFVEEDAKTIPVINYFIEQRDKILNKNAPQTATKPAEQYEVVMTYDREAQANKYSAALMALGLTNEVRKRNPDARPV